MAGDDLTLPTLIVVYGHRSLDAMTLRDAARGWCEVVWLIDAEDRSAAELTPLLRRSGAVVPALGLSAEAAAAELRPYAPSGIATFYDTGMAHVAAIASELGIGFNTPECALKLEDKAHQRAAFRSVGLPTPGVIEVPVNPDFAQVAEQVEALGYPVVLKPRRASGSWYTFRVDSRTELAERLEALAHVPTETIIEGYLPDGPPMPGGFEADYVSVETIAVDGVFTHLAVTGRFPPVEPLRETGFFIPATLDDDTTGEVLEVASQALVAVGFRWGAAHTELKLTPDGPRVIEINGRVGGGVPEMLAIATGVDIVKLAMRAALGLDLGVPSMPPTQAVGYRFFYQPPVGARRLLTIDGLAALRATEGVESLFMHLSPGAELDSAHGTRTYLFALVGRADSHADVAAMAEHIEAAVTTSYDGAGPPADVAAARP